MREFPTKTDASASQQTHMKPCEILRNEHTNLLCHSYLCRWGYPTTNENKFILGDRSRLEFHGMYSFRRLQSPTVSVYKKALGDRGHPESPMIKDAGRPASLSAR